MIPSDDDIRLSAYQQWERRGGGHACDREDWLAAEDHLKFWMNYRQIALYYLNCKPKVMIGQRAKVCRFCGRGKRKTSFRLIAHSVPEFFGNRSIISKDECDDCNAYFARNLEDHLAKMTMPLRTGFGISGKKGVPSFKSRAGNARLDRNNQSRRLLIMERYDDRFVTVDEDAKTMSIEMPAQPYVPIAALKCFTKIALSVMPENELGHFAGPLRWVRDPDHRRSDGHFKGAGCYVYTTTAPFNAPWIMLLKRIDPFARLNYIAMFIGAGQLLFQTSIPFGAMDDHLNGCRLELPPLASHLLPGCVLSNRYPVPLDNSNSNPDFKFSMLLTFDARIELPDGKPGDPPFPPITSRIFP